MAAHRVAVRLAKVVMPTATRRDRDAARRQLGRLLRVLREPAVFRTVHVDDHQSGSRNGDVRFGITLPPSFNLPGVDRRVVKSVTRQGRFAAGDAGKHRVSQLGVPVGCREKMGHAKAAALKVPHSVGNERASINYLPLRESRSRKSGKNRATNSRKGIGNNKLRRAVQKFDDHG